MILAGLEMAMELRVSSDSALPYHARTEPPPKLTIKCPKFWIIGKNLFALTLSLTNLA